MVKKSLLASLIVLLTLYGCGTPAKPKTAVAPGGATAISVSTAPGRVAEPPPSATAASEPGNVGTVAAALKGKKWFTPDGKAPDLKNKVYLVEFWQIA